MKPMLFTLLAMAGSAGATDMPTPQARLQAITPGSAVACATDSHGSEACTADGYIVDLGDCRGEAFYGAIAAAKGVDLDTALAPGSSDTTAHLQEGQFVCIKATAREGDMQRHYVVAIPTSSVPGCKGNDLCTGHDKPVAWKKAAKGETCHRQGKDGDYAGRCAAGWVDESDLDQYANGL